MKTLAVIGWYDAFVGPWEIGEFAKELSVAPPVMDGPLHREMKGRASSWQNAENTSSSLCRLSRTRELENRLDTIISDLDVQNLIHEM